LGEGHRHHSGLLLAQVGHLVYSRAMGPLTATNRRPKFQQVRPARVSGCSGF
jgi:hypothetical protein